LVLTIKVLKVWRELLIEVYRGALEHSGSAILKHFGSLPSAIDRMVSGFSGHKGLVVSSDGTWLYQPNPLIQARSMSSLEVVNEFCLSMKSVSIREYEFDDSKSLTLNDNWMDDPIGSGGMSIFDKQSITINQLETLWSIFKPFDGPVYPNKLHLKYSRNEIKSIIANLKKDKLGAAEFRARRQRSKYAGENFNDTKYQEAVWVDMTLKLRDWCLQNDYSSLCYKNNQEGNGENSFVALTDNVARQQKSIFFDEEQYRMLAAPMFVKSLESLNLFCGNKNCMLEDIVWGQNNPTMFWR
jgi:hypothetical protein